MRYALKKTIIILLISSVFCNEKYTFKNKYHTGQIVKTSVDNMYTLDIPGMGEVRNGNNYTLIEEYLEEKGEFIIIQSTITSEHII